MDTVKIGIIGTGWIAEKMAITLEGMEGVEAYAVASRQLQTACDFADRWGFTRANDLVNGGIIGRPMTLSANLGYPIGNRERLRQPALAGGALLDLGVYALNFASMVFGTDVERVTSTCVKTDTGVDAQNSITLTFKDGKIAVLHSSMLSMTDRQGIISGDKGHLIIENINNPQRIRVVTDDYKTAVVYNCPPQITGYESQVYASMEALRNGWLESPYMPHAETLRIMRMMDDLRREWGERYPADE